MKILNVTFTTCFGGLEQVFLDYTHALIARSHLVIPVIHYKSSLLPHIKSNCYKLKNFSKYDPFTLFRLNKLLKYEKPDIILTHGNRAHFLMQKIAGRIPIIGVCHGYNFQHIINCNYIIAVNKDLIQNLIDLGYGVNKVFYLPNMISFSSEINYSPPSFRSPIIFGFMGRLAKEKGIDIFIKALHLLNEENISFIAKIGGSGPEEAYIKKLIQELSLDNYIELVGWVEDKELFFKEIDIFCVPSISEAFGLVILEGLMYSKPTIISDLKGPSEIVENQKDGLTFTCGDAHSLASNMKLLSTNIELAKFLTINGYKKAQTYDANIIGSSLEKILTNILQENNDK